MINARLIINGEEVDVYDFEAIELTDVIQDVSDIGEIFTEFTQQFSLPASKRNNRIFKHYYNSSIVNGFDARFKADALIQVGGADFKKGKIRLNGVSMKDGKPSSYKVVFFGNTVKFSDILGKDELSTLSYLNNWNHERTVTYAKSGLDSGLFLNQAGGMVSANGKEQRDLVYPLISAKTHYFYDSVISNTSLGGIADSRNINSSTNPTLNPDTGINYSDLKPAIRLKHILDGIEDRYSGLEFDRTFFNQDQFNDLYMLLHRGKGTLTNPDAEGRKATSIYSLNDILSSAPAITTYDKSPQFTEVEEYIKTVTIKWTVTPSATSEGTYDMDILNNGNVLESRIGVSTDVSTEFEVTLSSNQGVFLENYDLSFRISSEDTGFVDFSTSIRYLSDEYELKASNQDDEYVVNRTGGDDITGSTLSESLLHTVVITEQIPKMRILDFLTSIFKMFNLTAYFDNDTGKIMCMPLSDYYASGNNINITPYIITDENTFKRGKIYSELNYSYAKTKLFANSERNNQVGEVFGDLDYDASRILGNAFDGSKYKTEVKFEHMLYERMTDQSDPSDITDMQWGWLVDEKESPIATSPLIFYNVNQTIGSNYEIGFPQDSDTISTYNRPSNALNGGGQTINFNAEIDEFTLTTNESSLFRNYYSGYIEDVFNPRTRVFECEAYLPYKVLLKYSLKDTFQINNTKYRINKMKYNLLTGKSDLELINAELLTIASEGSDGNDGSGIVSAPTNLSTLQVSAVALQISITPAFSPYGIKEYKVYLDTNLLETITLQADDITELDITHNEGNGISFDITLVAVDFAGNLSPISESLTVTTPQ